MKALSGHTMPFAVLGHPVGHTLSPLMHNASIEKLGLDAIYMAFDVHPDNLMDVLSSMQKMGFKGVNLTVPLKEVAFRGLSDLAESARLTGAVNTVEFRNNGTIRGHSTDGKGFLAAIDEAFEASVAELKVLILGAGGAGRTVAITCAKAGAPCITLVDIDRNRTEKVAAEIADIAPACRVDTSVHGESPSTSRANLIVQATPVGMKQTDEPLLKADSFRKNQLIYDLVYMYPETGFMKEAAKAGAKCANGLSMLLHQGAASFKIWTDTDPDITAMRTALETNVYDN